MVAISVFKRTTIKKKAMNCFLYDLLKIVPFAITNKVGGGGRGVIY